MNPESISAKMRLKICRKSSQTQAFIEKIRPAFEKYKNIGVRIEDDMLVTATGAEWLTKKLPRKIDEIEAFMAKAAPEFADYKQPKLEPQNVGFLFNKTNLFSGNN